MLKTWRLDENLLDVANRLGVDPVKEFISFILTTRLKMEAVKKVSMEMPFTPYYLIES